MGCLESLGQISSAFRFELQPCMAYVRRGSACECSLVHSAGNAAGRVMFGTAPTLRSWNLSILMSITYQKILFLERGIQFIS
jgi:hypothetical protein